MRDDDYLWNPSAAPNPDVAQLEDVLRRYRLDPQSLPVDLIARDEDRRARDDSSNVPDVAEIAHRRQGRSSGASMRARWGMAAAAALVVLVGAQWMARQQLRPWQVSVVQGTTRIGARLLDRPHELRPGEWLETDAASSARLNVGRIGRADIGPGSRIQVVRAAGTEHRLALLRGVLHARIWAPPRFFLVETPSAVAVDLGCVYTLVVDSLGAGVLRVESGEVDLVGQHGSVLVPAGNRAVLRSGTGPGLPTPAIDDPTYDRLLAVVDGGAFDSASVAQLVEASGRERTITLWHLLRRVDGRERAMVVDRLMRLAPPPSSVTRADVIAGDRAALNAWRDVLAPSWSSEQVPGWKRLWRQLWERARRA